MASSTSLYAVASKKNRTGGSVYLTIECVNTVITSVILSVYISSHEGRGMGYTYPCQEGHKTCCSPWGRLVLEGSLGSGLPHGIRI